MTDAKPQPLVRYFPVAFTWTEDEVMRPSPRQLMLCRKQFVVGEDYHLAPLEARSRRSHSHYFAALGDIFDNLPEQYARKFPTSEHLRAWALVEAGYYTETDIVCDTDRDAKRLAAFVRKNKPYTVIRASGPVVKMFEPMSQSGQAMGREAFQDSKTKVLDICAALTNTPREDFEREAAEKVPRERKPTNAGL